MAEKRIRVLIVDDSAFMRKVLQSILTADPQIEVAGEARDGRDAVAKAESLKPDVITMDINMPVMDGLQATENIMASNPRPILIVSSESRDGAETTLKALELGAIDFVAKPSSGVDLDMNTVRDELTRKLKIAAKVRVVRTAARSKVQKEVANSAPRVDPKKSNERTNGGTGSSAGANYKPAATAQAHNGRFPLVMIACSTGGPATLMKFVPLFGKNFPAAVVIVQHMPGTFTAQFSQQLSEIAAIGVKEAEHNETIQPGTVYVCPGSHHLRVSSSGRIALDDGPRISGYRPCADVAFETAAAFAGAMTIGVILTGMGNDGARGIQAVKSVGGFAVVQDEATSVIFGMPAEAIKTGAVDLVLPLEEIFPAVEKRVLQACGIARVGTL
jgi:two-component system, chemotaxis family, protein-glutamate methylesterase/glutaminase